MKLRIFKKRHCRRCGFRMRPFQTRCDPCGWRVPHAKLLLSAYVGVAIGLFLLIIKLIIDATPLK